MINKNHVIVVLLGINILLLSFVLKPYIKNRLENIASSNQGKQRDEIFEQINPEKGYVLNASFDDLGPKMLASGVIDFKKFTAVFTQGSQPLTKQQVNVLTNKTNEKIKITRDNSYFLLNFFWAVGLANKTKILTEGDMVKNGDPANYASTGGWTLSKDNPMNYYAKSVLIPLTTKQEELVNRVASNIYRPCCGNSTAFPDCNHGMALLGVLELLASKGATENQMYEAAKYINAYWFPSTYYDLAQYFKAKEGKDFSRVSAKTVLGNAYSSGAGYMTIKKWLVDKGIIKQPPRQGGSCGV